MKNFYCFLFLLTVISSCKKDQEPACDFSFSGIMEAGENIQFTNLSSNCDDFSWDFGDGGTSNAQNPAHIYSKPGNYGVSLAASGNGEPLSTNKSLMITGTTYSISNNTTFTLYDFGTFTYDGVNISNIEYIGALEIGATSRIIKTNRTSIYLVFSFESNGNLYFSAYPFMLNPNMHNDLIIDNNTKIISSSGRNISIQKN